MVSPLPDPSTMVTSGLSDLLSEAHAIRRPPSVRIVMRKLENPPKNDMRSPSENVDDENWELTENGTVMWLLCELLLNATNCMPYVPEL